MIIHDAIQGSPEWHALRLGVLTASRAAQLFTPGGTPTIPQHYRVVSGSSEPPARARKQSDIWHSLKEYGPHPIEQSSASARAALLAACRIEECDPPDDAVPVAKPIRRSVARSGLLDALLHEQFTGTSAEAFGGSAWTEHGHAVEPEACAYFAMETGLNALPVGFVTDADRPGVGCSPDALIRDSGGDLVAGLELKAPAGWTHIGYLRAGIVPPEYMMQIQFSLWVTGLPLWYFMSYGASPYGGDWLPTWQPGAYLPPLLLEVEPEERYQDAFAEHVTYFMCDLESARDALIDAGAKLPNER